MRATLSTRECFGLVGLLIASFARVSLVECRLHAGFGDTVRLFVVVVHSLPGSSILFHMCFFQSCFEIPVHPCYGFSLPKREAMVC